MWTGQLTEDEMLHEHPLELADIKAGMADRTPPAAVLRRRQLIYYPIAAIFAAGSLFGIYGFVLGEQTAITTVPPQIATIPDLCAANADSAAARLRRSRRLGDRRPPRLRRRPAAAGPVTWVEVGPIFAARCGTCHGASLATNGLNLGTFADAIKGAQDGPVIVAGGCGQQQVDLRSSPRAGIQAS